LSRDLTLSDSGRINPGGIHQHNRDVVLNRVHPSALAAFQALTSQYDRLPAHRTYQRLEQIFGDHGAHSTVNHRSLTGPDVRQARTRVRGQFRKNNAERRGNRSPNRARRCDRMSFKRELESNEMTARILDGTKIAAEIRAEVATEVEALARSGIRPGLAVVLVGHNPASEVYVRGKVKSSEEVGLYSEQHSPDDKATTEELLALISDLNHRDEIDGILVQLPLPAHVDAKKILLAVDPSKDVDGFHPLNVGYLSTQRPGLVPCTPAGVMEILKRSQIPVAGQEAVVVGRSDIVGKPVAMLLLNQNATVTICHSKTRDLPEVCRRADILVAAIGRAGMVTRDYITPGATVIDVGINKITDQKEFDRFFAGNRKREETFLAKGSTLVGDVHPEVAEIAGAITPVPGGVGPLTIAMLMANTVKAATLRRGLRQPELTRA